MNTIVKVTGLIVLAAAGMFVGLSFAAGSAEQQAPAGESSRHRAETPTPTPPSPADGTAPQTPRVGQPSTTPTPSPDPTVPPAAAETPTPTPPSPAGGTAPQTPEVGLPSATPAPTPDPTPPPSPTGPAPEIAIVGDGDCVSRTSEALALLREKAKDHHDLVAGHVGVIECAESGSGMYAWEDPPRFKVGRATVQAGAVWFAGTIAHDACHSKLYQDYASDHPSDPVPDDVWSGRTAEAWCLDVQYDALGQIGASQDTLDYVRATIDTDYWEVDAGERWW